MTAQSSNGKCKPSIWMPTDRFEWERIVRRLVAPKHVKFLALVLATYADTDGTNVRPGNKRLAAVTGDDVRNVQRILRVLRDELGLLEVVSRGGGRAGSGKTSVQRLVVPVDLLERATLLDPDEQSVDSPDIWVSGQSGPLSGHPDVRSLRAFTGHLGVRSMTPAAGD